jgi:putative membrane protein
MKVQKRIEKWAAGIVVCTAMFSLASCSGNGSGSADQQVTKDTTATTAPAPAPAPATPTFTDPEIASIAVTANQIDVDYGKLALEKSKNADVKKFAQTMIKDHSDIIKQATDLAKKLNVTPQDNSMTQSLLNGEKTTMEKLKALSGHDFDTAYINNEVGYHAAVIDAVKNVLTPQIQNAELKDLIVKVTPLLDHHLEMAKEDQAKIDK